MPPLSGFVGKLLILEAATDQAHWPWLWAVVLGGSLLAMIGFARAGSLVFWKCLADPGEPEPDRPRHDTWACASRWRWSPHRRCSHSSPGRR